MKWDLEFENIMSRLDQRGVLPLNVPSLAPSEEGLKRIGFFDSQLFKKIMQDPKKSIIVAGTNGKGSTCATLEKLLSARGKSVGLYTSPHLIEATERIRFCETNISKKDFCLSYASLIKKTRGLELSHFETLTLMAVEYFMNKLPDFLIWEVGMGGTWDATNAIPHGTCVITRLGHDHEKFLGRSLFEIAKNKLGVVRSFSNISVTPNVVYLPMEAEAESARNEVESSIPAHWWAVKTRQYKVEPGNPPRWYLKEEHQWAELGLLGQRAAENSSIALDTLKSLGLNVIDSLNDLKNVQWPGRMEEIAYKGRKVFLSGDHNPQGMQSLLEILKHFRYEKLQVLLGMSNDKDLHETLHPLLQVQNLLLHLTESPFKGRKLSEFGDYQKRAHWCETDPFLALERLCTEAKPNDMVLITGSLYLVGKIRARILSSQHG